MADIDYKEGQSGNRGIVYLTYQSLMYEQEDFLEATRDISHKSGLTLAGVSCSAKIIRGDVTEYKVRFANNKSLYAVELNPDGTVQRAYQDSEGSDEYKDVVTNVQRFPTFPDLLQRFVTTPIDPDQPTSVFSPAGNSLNELA